MGGDSVDRLGQGPGLVGLAGYKSFKSFSAGNNWFLLVPTDYQ